MLRCLCHLSTVHTSCTIHSRSLIIFGFHFPHIIHAYILYCTLNHNKNKPTKTKSAYSVPKHLMKASSASLLRSKKQYCIHWSFIVHYTRTKTAILSSYLQFFTQHRARPEFSYFISGMTKIFKTIKTSHCV